ncbi:hypothetical protein EsDP_00000739 [Epichloe bromicola]|uniref:Uncharacterized protein n=1 Tax=Epichloe bromicola TaxID=79588 RepID=A0ABQ0CFT1_9HYPO
MVSTVILVVFTALATGSYYKGEAIGMFNMLTAWRFFVGIGIGGEYPAGSVGCAESTGELKTGTRNRWFILFTNTMIDWGFVFGAFVPYVVAAACHGSHLETIWRTSLGIGVVFPLVLLVMRLRLKEPLEFAKESMPLTRLASIRAIFFKESMAMRLRSRLFFGWNTVINMFYLPGTMLGAFVSDWVGPKYTLIGGVVVQSIVGFIMAGVYPKIKTHIAGFAIVYGIFLSLGELGPGNNIGLLAAKTGATGVRGRYYGIASAIGKIGAFVGTFVFPYIQAAGGEGTVESAQYPFWVASSLCIFSAAVAFFFIPNIDQDTIAEEDKRFRAFLESHGWDTNQLGLEKGDAEIGPVEQDEHAPGKLSSH